MFANPLYAFLMDANTKVPFEFTVTKTKKNKKKAAKNYLLITLENQPGINLEHHHQQLVFQGHHISIYERQMDDVKYPQMGSYHYTADYLCDETPYKLHVYFDKDYQVSEIVLKREQGSEMLSESMTPALKTLCQHIACMASRSTIGQISELLQVAQEQQEQTMSATLTKLMTLSIALPRSQDAYIMQAEVCLEAMHAYQTLTVYDKLLQAEIKLVEQGMRYLRCRRDSIVDTSSDDANSDQENIATASTSGMLMQFDGKRTTKAKPKNQLDREQAQQLLMTLASAKTNFVEAAKETLAIRLDKLAAYEKPLIGFECLDYKVSSANSFLMTQINRHIEQVKTLQLELLWQAIQTGALTLAGKYLKSLDSKTLFKLLVATIRAGYSEALIILLAHSNANILNRIFIDGKPAVEYCHDKSIEKEVTMSARQAYRRCLAVLVMADASLIESSTCGIPLAFLIFFSPAFADFYDIPEVHQKTFADPAFKAAIKQFMASEQGKIKLEVIASAEDMALLQEHCNQPNERRARSTSIERQTDHTMQNCLRNSFFSRVDNRLTYDLELQKLKSDCLVIEKQSANLLRARVKHNKDFIKILHKLYKEHGINPEHQPVDLLYYDSVEPKAAALILKKRIEYLKVQLNVYKEIISSCEGYMHGQLNVMESFFSVSSQLIIMKQLQLNVMFGEAGVIVCDEASKGRIPKQVSRLSTAGT